MPFRRIWEPALSTPTALTLLIGAWRAGVCSMMPPAKRGSTRGFPDATPEFGT